MVYTDCVRDKTKKQKIQKDFSDWLSASLLKTKQMKKNTHSFRCKKAASGMIHKPMEKLWHISIKQQSSATVPKSSN